MVDSNNIKENKTVKDKELNDPVKFSIGEVVKHRYYSFYGVPIWFSGRCHMIPVGCYRVTYWDIIIWLLEVLKFNSLGCYHLIS